MADSEDFDADTSPAPGSALRTVRVAVAAGWVALVVAWVWRLQATGTSPLESVQSFVDALDGQWWAIPAFIAVYALRPLLLFPASILTVAAGLLFGPWLGVAVAVVASNISALVAFEVGRTFSPEALGSADEASLLARWAGRMQAKSFVTVMVMRLAFLPYDLVNYASGFLRINRVAFLGATALGSLPGTVAFVLAGASIEELDAGVGGFNPAVFAASVAIFAASMIVARLVQRREGADPQPITARG